MGWHAAPRLSAFDYVGVYAYSVTICTFQRRPYFLRREVSQPAIDQLLQSAAANRFELLAYCVMPDHVHILTQGHASESNLRRFVAHWKQYTGFELRQLVGGRLWQSGFWDRVLRSDEDLLRIARYIVCNPVRSRLVGSPGAYEYWGSQRWTREAMLEGM